MAPTRTPQEKGKRRRRLYGLFFVGAFMLAAAVMLAFPAIQFAFQTDGSGGTAGDGGYSYEYLTEDEQRVVDAAIDGDRVILEDSQPLPGTPGYPLGTDEVRVNKNGTVHTFTYRIVFPATEPMGLAVLALTGGGLVAVVESVRRHHFVR
jgi:hypothetical protein